MAAEGSHMASISRLFAVGKRAPAALATGAEDLMNKSEVRRKQ